MKLTRSRILHAAPAALAVLALAGPAQASLHEAADVTTSTTRGENRALSLQMYGTRIDSLATATRLARSHRIISMQPTQLNGYGAAMKAANPDLRLFVYVNGMFAQSSQGTTYPAAWYMRDANGNKIRSRGYGNFLMDPRKTASYTVGGRTYSSWRQLVAARCADAIARSAGAFGGCFLDMLGTAPLSRSYNQNNAVPVKDASGARFSGREWIATVSGPVADTTERVSGKPVYGNGIGSGTRFYSDEASNVLLDFATAGDAEVWMRGPAASATAFPTASKWSNEVRMLKDAHTADGVVNATVKVWRSATAAQIEQWRRFSYGSFLLGNDGNATFEFTAARTLAAASADTPLYNAPIGQPAETLTLDGYLRRGVFQRAFTGGRVLVNPGTAAVTVTLPTALRTLTGQTVTRVTVPAHDAAILVG